MKPLITLKETAERIGIAEGTLRMWRVQGKGPEGFVPGGRRVMFRPEVVEQWLAEQEAATSSNSSARQDAK